jgi:serine/threonine protein kinase
VHRDIKPDNIMFDEFGQCVVTDFGIAKAGSGSKLTGTGMSIGTPHYMSPEQARAQSIDGRSDLYSLGVLAYQALVGEVPYDGEDSFAIGYKHIMEPIPVPLLDTPDERRLFEVIKRLIQKDPLDRYQTADDLLRALEGQPLAQARRASQAQNTMAVQAAPPSPASPLQRPSVSNMPPPPPPAQRPSIAVPPAGVSMDTPRRPVMRRSVTVQEEQRTNWVPWVVAGIVILGFLIGGIMLYRRGAFGGGNTAAPDTAAPQAPVTPPNPQEESNLDSAIAQLDTIGPAPVSANTPVPERSADPVRVADTGFGFLRLRNLPPRSVILIDSRPVTQPGGSDIRLSAGWHELGITSPGFALFTDSVKIESGRTLSFGPNLSSAPTGAAAPGSRQEMRNRLLARMDCDNPAPLNRYGRECYDTAPQPLASTLVPVPEGIAGTPSGVTVIVKVSYQGRTLIVRTRSPSSDERFTRAVEQYANTMRWTPAMRDGQPVDGWTQYAFQPATP